MKVLLASRENGGKITKFLISGEKRVADTARPICALRSLHFKWTFVTVGPQYDAIF